MTLIVYRQQTTRMGASDTESFQNSPASTLSGQVELSFSTDSSYENETFKVHIQNKSNQMASLDMDSFSLVELSDSNRSTASQRTVIKSNDCSADLTPGAECSIEIENNSSSLSFSRSNPTVFAEIDVDYNRNNRFTRARSNRTNSDNGYINIVSRTRPIQKAHFSYFPNGGSSSSVRCEGYFDVYMKNSSNREMKVNLSSFRAISNRTGKNYVASGEVEITNDLGCRETIQPGESCWFQVQNKIEARNAIVTLLAQVQVQYYERGQVVDFETVDDLYFQGKRYGPYISFLGCN